MWADDQASQELDMELTEVGPGRAQMSMTIGQRMVNGHGVCHGGYIFALADTAASGAEAPPLAAFAPEVRTGADAP